MSLEDRIQSLRLKHQNLDAKIQAESSRPYPDSVALKKMKLEKLRVKEELTRLVAT